MVRAFLRRAVLLIPPIRRLYDESNAALSRLKEAEARIASFERVLGTKTGLERYRSGTSIEHLFPISTAALGPTYYDQLLVDALFVLEFSDLQSLPLEEQVSTIERIFLCFLTCQHRDSALVGLVMARHFRRMLMIKDVPLPILCRMYDFLYGMFWCGAQSFKEMQWFDANAVLPFAKHLQRVCQVAASLSSTVGPPKRIAYFCHYAHRVSGNAVGPFLQSVVKEHATRSDRGIFLYCVQWSTPDFTSDIAKAGVIVRDLPQELNYSGLENIVRQLAADRIDVVVTDIASSISSYVFARRSAPLQIWMEFGYPFWSSPHLDWTFLTSKDYQSVFGIRPDRFSHVEARQEQLTLTRTVDEQALQEARKHLPHGKKILAVFTRLIKLTDQFFMIAGELLKRLPETHLLIVGTGDDRSVQEFVDDPRCKGRVTFWHRNVDLNVYGRTIDVMLDTFPFVGGNACREVAIHGKPVVSMRSVDWNRLLTKERDPLLLASTPEEYVEMVTRLVRDEHFYKARGEAVGALTLDRATAAKMVDDIEAGIGQAYATLRVGSRCPAIS